eukprot:g76887.t1
MLPRDTFWGGYLRSTHGLVPLFSDEVRYGRSPVADTDEVTAGEALEEELAGGAGRRATFFFLDINRLFLLSLSLFDTKGVSYGVGVRLSPVDRK